MRRNIFYFTFQSNQFERKMKQKSFSIVKSIKCRPKACNFVKRETLAQVFFCEFCEISKNTFLHRTPLVAASGLYQQHF